MCLVIDIMSEAKKKSTKSTKSTIKVYKNFNLEDYVKSELNTLDYNTLEEKREKEKKAKNCLENIGKSLGEYTDFHQMLNSMSNGALRELNEAIEDVRFDRKRFTNWVNCSREEADKPADENRSCGFYTYGEFGGDYGYFKHVRKLNDIEKDWLDEYKECCYYHGQPCARWQGELDSRDEDCECVLGKEYCSLNLYELNMEEEKNCGVFPQKITWSLNDGGNNDSNTCYYSLQELKLDVFQGQCNHTIKVQDKNGIFGSECLVCNNVMKYDGKTNFKEGSVDICVLIDGEKLEENENPEEIH